MEYARFLDGAFTTLEDMCSGQKGYEMAKENEAMLSGYARFNGCKPVVRRPFPGEGYKENWRDTGEQMVQEWKEGE